MIQLKKCPRDSKLHQAIMDEFQAIDLCSFDLDIESDKTFYDICDSDKEFFEKHSLNLWGKCECKEKQCMDSLEYLTPPTSPQHEYDNCLATHEILNEAVDNVDDDLLTSAYLAAEMFADMNFDADPVIQDCMWSAPGLAAAGFLAPATQKSGSKKRRANVDENCNDIVSKKSNLDIKRIECVDPAVVFPQETARITSPILTNAVENTSQNHEWISGLETPPASESDEEIDVVGDVHNKQVTSKSCLNKNSVPSSSPALNSTIKSRPILSINNTNGGSALGSTTLPATTSMSAQVAALHNYSSTTPAVKSHSCLRTSLSAPQTPASSSGLTGVLYDRHNSHSHHHSSALKRSRSHFSSSPTSPQSFKKQRLHHHYHDRSGKDRFIHNEKDLQSVVRKLHHSSSSSNSRRSRACLDPHSYSRSSSDNEDMSETGKRAYHNVLERKRRDDLRLSFHMLRQVVPEICENERAPKMVILNTSTEYVVDLTRKSQELNFELQKQRRYNERLKKTLAQLREDIC